MAAKTIKLSKPIKGVGGGLLDTIAMRKPGYRDLIEIGMPSYWVFVGGAGGGFEQESPEIIEKWIARLLVDVDPNFLDQIDNLEDALMLREAVLDFFREAHKAVAQRKAA